MYTKDKLKLMKNFITNIKILNILIYLGNLEECIWL